MSHENKESVEFVNVFEIQNSQFHFKPDRIADINDEYVTMDGTEAMSNSKLSIRIPHDQFTQICLKNPKETSRFLVDYYHHKHE